MRVYRVVLLVSSIIWTAPCLARTLEVGPGKQYKAPSAAVAVARNGDTIMIAPGQYFDCATIKQNDLTIAGSAAGAVMTDKTCGGKALLVIDGNNVTVRNLTLQRARVADNNGAGIRAEGGNLTVENSHFINNQDGILAANNPQATIRIIGSEFADNGICAGSCAHALYVGNIKLLQVQHSHFIDTHDGHSIKSRAARTEITNTIIEDGPGGTSSYLIDIPSGGDVVIRNNVLEKGPHSGNQANAIMIGEEGVDQPTNEIIVENNKFTNHTGRLTTFVHNITATPAQLSGNRFEGQVRPLEGDGSQR